MASEIQSNELVANYIASQVGSLVEGYSVGIGSGLYCFVPVAGSSDHDSNVKQGLEKMLSSWKMALQKDQECVLQIQEAFKDADASTALRFMGIGV